MERRVSEQAKQRALSIAAEASLQRKQVEALRQKVGVAEGGGNAESSPPTGPRPPFLSSTDILTPTPVAPPITSQSSPVVGDRLVPLMAAAGSAAQSGSSSGEGDSTSSLFDDETQPAATGQDQSKAERTVFKSLGNWSIKEFEGDAMDPFEIASLQAINDMEELQSVLQPTPPPTTAATIAAAASASSSSPSSPAVQVGVSSSSHSLVAPSQSPPVTAASHQSTTATQLSTILTSTARTGQLPSHVVPHPPQATPSSPGLPRTGVVSSSSDMTVSTSSPLSSSPLTRGHFNAPAALSTNPFHPGPPVVATMSGTNPFQRSEPIQSNAHFATPVSGIASTPNLQPQQQQMQEPQRGKSEPGVGTLVDLGGGTSAAPVPAPRSSPKTQVSTLTTTSLHSCGVH